MIFLFNGPPGSGKDYCADYMNETFGYNRASFKDALFIETFEYFKVSKEWFMGGYTREQKDVKEDKLSGNSRREALILVSETIKKPKFGKKHYGIELAKKIDITLDYAISDCGFFDEIHPIINKINDNSKIVIVTLFRDNCDFSNDSRNYLPYETNVKEYILSKRTDVTFDFEKNCLPLCGYKIHNNGTLEELHNALKDIHIREQNVIRFTKEKNIF